MVSWLWTHYNVDKDDDIIEPAEDGERDKIYVDNIEIVSLQKKRKGDKRYVDTGHCSSPVSAVHWLR